MKITDRLRVEHGVFLQQLRVLRSLVELKAPNAILARLVEGLGPFQLEGAKGRAMGHDERDDDEPVGRVLFGSRWPG